MNKINNYLEEIYIQEDIKTALADYKNLDKAAFMKIKKVVNERDPKGTFKKLKRMVPPGFNPKTAITKMDAVLGMKISEYPKMKKRATLVVKNSVSGVSEPMANAAGTFLAFQSLFVKKGQENIAIEKNLQNNLKSFVVKVRKFGAEYEDDEEKKDKRIRPSDYADISVAWVIITMSTALAVGIGVGVYVSLKIVALAFAATLPFMMSMLTYTMCGIMIFVAFLIIAGRLGIGG